MHTPKIDQPAPRPGAGRRAGGGPKDVDGKRAQAMRTAMAPSSDETSRSATRTPGTGLNRATTIGHVAAPIPQQKLSAPSADAARCGREARDDHVGRGHDEPDADAGDGDRERARHPLAEREAGKASRHQRIPGRERRAGAEPGDDQAREGAGHDAPGELDA